MRELWQTYHFDQGGKRITNWWYNYKREYYRMSEASEGVDEVAN